VAGFDPVDPWTVAKPLLLLLFLPMAAGMAVKTVAPFVAVWLLKVVRPIASAATALLLVAVGLRYFEGFVGAVGSYAIAAQLIYAVGLVLGSHALGAGMPASRRSVLSLGACSRNLGAALALLLVTPADPRAMVMVALAVPITLGVTYLAAGWLSNRAKRSIDDLVGQVPRERKKRGHPAQAGRPSLLDPTALLHRNRDVCVPGDVDLVANLDLGRTQSDRRYADCISSRSWSAPRSGTSSQVRIRPRSASPSADRSAA
jgi:hypothetical protein